VQSVTARRRIKRDDLHSLSKLSTSLPGLRSVPLVVLTGTGSSTSSTNFALNGLGTGPFAIMRPGIVSMAAGSGTASTVATNPNGDADPIAGNVGDATKAYAQ